jgi:hypothetical protein
MRPLSSPPTRSQRRIVQPASPERPSHTQNKAISPALSLSDDTSSSEHLPKRNVTTQRRRYIPSEPSESSSEYVASGEEQGLVIPLSDSDSELSSLESAGPSKEETSGTKSSLAKGRSPRLSTSPPDYTRQEPVIIVPQHLLRGTRPARRRSEQSQSDLSDHKQEGSLLTLSKIILSEPLSLVTYRNGTHTRLHSCRDSAGQSISPSASPPKKGHPIQTHSTDIFRRKLSLITHHTITPRPEGTRRVTSGSRYEI